MERPKSEDYHPYGETAPLDKIAVAFGVDPAITLALADAMLHSRRPHRMIQVDIDAMPMATFAPMFRQVTKVCDHTRALWYFGQATNLVQPSVEYLYA